jgi:hypothetical protein
MAFQLVYYSQQDPKWKEDVLGLGTLPDTIGFVGCALTSVAMLLSGYGYTESPKTLNDKMKAAGGFISSSIRWEVINKIHPQVTLKTNYKCETSDAPLSEIDAALAAGHPVVVRVDAKPSPGLQWHYVLIYARKGEDYLMLDPWPYQPGTAREDSLMARYSQGNSLKRAIQHVLIYEATGAGGPIATPGGTSTQTPPAPAPVPTPAPSSGPVYVRPNAEVTAYLNMRSSTDTSSTANVVAQIHPGTQLLLLDAGAESKLGVNGQFIRARDPQGHEGLVAAWYVERVPSASSTASNSSSNNGELKVIISPRVVDAKIKIYASASTTGAVVATENKDIVLVVDEDVNGAKAKIGVKGKWIRVRSSAGKRGFVKAEYIQLV